MSNVSKWLVHHFLVAMFWIVASGGIAAIGIHDALIHILHGLSILFTGHSNIGTPVVKP